MIVSKAIPFEATHKFSKIFIDYINEIPELVEFYNRYPTIPNFKAQLEAKKFSPKNREILKIVFKKQYEGFAKSEIIKQTIDSIQNANTFTVTTGHQLCLFTGPLYFIYKMITAIELANELKANFPDYNFVPIYWMASEDHDFEEINHFTVFGKKYEWQTEQKGAVGTFATNELNELVDSLPIEIRILFENIYLKHQNLAEATRYLVHALFPESGLLILDGNDSTLKSIIKNVIINELTSNEIFETVQSSTQKLENAGYSSQVYAREINLFYLDKGIRERIVKEGNVYKVLNTNLSFTTTEIIALANSNPEKFSPNVVLRPLYQEMVLPNLAYIGGPGELAYWLQLKQMFANQNIEFPILVPRNFALVATQSQITKLDKAGLPIDSLFLDEPELKKFYIEAKQIAHWDENSYKTEIDKIFDAIKTEAMQVDKSLEGFVESQRNEGLKIIDVIAKKIRKTAELKESEGINQILNIKSKLFPSAGLQERTDNYLNFQINNPDFIAELIPLFQPLKFEFNIIVQD